MPRSVTDEERGTVEASTAALIGGALGIGIGWGLHRIRRPHRRRTSNEIIHRLVLSHHATPTVTPRPMSWSPVVDWQTQPDFDPAIPMEEP